MDAPLDLYGASREDLIAVIVQQRAQIADLEQRLGRQEADLATLRATIGQLSERVGGLLAAAEPTPGDEPSGQSNGMPGLKPAGTRRTQPPTPPLRKRRAQGYGRKRMRPTARQVHALAHCPHCRTSLRGGTVNRTREVIEVIPSPVLVTEHVYLERRCPRCGGHWLPGPELDGVVVGQGRLGVGLLSLIAVLREELRLPVAGIQWYLEAVHGLHLSVGAIVGVLHTVARWAAPMVADLRAAIRASPVLHVDETGWREDGRNGYVWTFSTERARAFVRGSRARAVLEQEIGDDYPGTLISDFYAAYTTYAGRHQYCWAHLLRDVDDLVSEHRDAAGVVGWADGVHVLYQRATRGRSRGAPPSAAGRRGDPGDAVRAIPGRG